MIKKVEIKVTTYIQFILSIMICLCSWVYLGLVPEYLLLYKQQKHK